LSHIERPLSSSSRVVLFELNVVIVLLYEVLLSFTDLIALWLSIHIMRLTPLMVKVCLGLDIRLTIGHLQILRTIFMGTFRLGLLREGVFVHFYLVILDLNHLLHAFEFVEIILVQVIG
jgi:hypothetical protein